MFNTKLYNAISDISLWTKVKDNDPLYWTDIPKIIPMRWDFLKNKWNFIKEDILDQSSDLEESDYIRQQVDSFSRFLEIQRSSTIIVNPLENENEIFNYHGIFSSMLITNANINRAESEIIESEKQRVRNFNKSNFIDIRNTITEARDAIADEIGLQDEDYNTSFNRSSSSPQLKPNISYITRMSILQDMIDQVNSIIVNLNKEPEGGYIDPFAIARINANNEDINIGLNKSGFLTKLNYGETLQSLAIRYFNNQDKWIDIAIANGLKSPYIDEIGEVIPLITNANKNRINIAGLDINSKGNMEKLYINQIVLLQSNTERSPDQRVILSIKQIPISNEIVIELDGELDLNKYTVQDSATIKIFKPNTINSNFYIMIPTEEETTDGVNNKEIPFFLQGKKEDEKKAGVDLAINEYTNDLILTSSSDLQLSYGVANAVQAIKMKFMTERGSLKFHSDYGLINVIGYKSDFKVIRNILIESINEQIYADSRFDRVENLDVLELDPSTILVRMTVKMSGSNTNLPINFTVSK